MGVIGGKGCSGWGSCAAGVWCRIMGERDLFGRRAAQECAVV